MADRVSILTSEQEKVLVLISEEPYLCRNYYFTGGTALAAFYLEHRLSEDIDLFSEREVELPRIEKFLKVAKEKLELKNIEYNQFLGLHSFQLFFSPANVLKIDFNYYPFGRIEKGMKYLNISVDSILDIAVNKTHTIFMKPRARDFIDIYFILKENKYSFSDLIIYAKTKFDWHIDSVLFGARLMAASTTTDFPRMIKPIEHKEWRNIFVEEAKKLKAEIF